MHLKCGGQERRHCARTWKQNQENIGRKLTSGSVTVVGVVVRGYLGWRKLEERREEKKLLFEWRLQRKSENRLEVVDLLNDCGGWWAEHCELKRKF